MGLERDRGYGFGSRTSTDYRNSLKLLFMAWRNLDYSG